MIDICEKSKDGTHLARQLNRAGNRGEVTDAEPAQDAKARSETSSGKGRSLDEKIAFGGSGRYRRYPCRGGGPGTGCARFHAHDVRWLLRRDRSDQPSRVGLTQSCRW